MSEENVDQEQEDQTTKAKYTTRHGSHLTKTTEGVSQETTEDTQDQQQ